MDAPRGLLSLLFNNPGAFGWAFKARRALLQRRTRAAGTSPSPPARHSPNTRGANRGGLGLGWPLCCWPCWELAPNGAGTPCQAEHGCGNRGVAPRQRGTGCSGMGCFGTGCCALGPAGTGLAWAGFPAYFQPCSPANLQSTRPEPCFPGSCLHPGCSCAPSSSDHPQHLMQRGDVQNMSHIAACSSPYPLGQAFQCWSPLWFENPAGEGLLHPDLSTHGCNRSGSSAGSLSRGWSLTSRATF